MEKPRILKTNTEYSIPSNNIDDLTAACVSEFMNAGTSFHKLHLKVNGAGAYAAHKALNDLYEIMPDHADTLAEGYQGVSEKLLNCKEVPCKTLNTVSDGLNYIRELYNMVNLLQSKMPYSELINALDNVKDSLASAKYKLLFLK